MFLCSVKFQSLCYTPFFPVLSGWTILQYWSCENLSDDVRTIFSIGNWRMERSHRAFQDRPKWPDVPKVNVILKQKLRDPGWQLEDGKIAPGIIPRPAKRPVAPKLPDAPKVSMHNSWCSLNNRRHSVASKNASEPSSHVCTQNLAVCQKCSFVL